MEPNHSPDNPFVDQPNEATEAETPDEPEVVSVDEEELAKLADMSAPLSSEEL